MEKNIKAVLFDLDGVIVFTDKYHYLGWKKLSDEEGLAFDEVVNEGLRGVSRMESLEVILKHNNVNFPLDKKVEMANRKNEYYVQLLKDINNEDMFPGAVKFIKNLREKAVKIGLCSSSKNAEFVLKKLDLYELFDVVVTGNDIVNTKPDPEIFLKAAELLNLHPLNCIVFEDAEAGVNAAVAAKMKCIGVGEIDFSHLIDESIKSYEEIDIDEMLVSGRKAGIPILPWLIKEIEMNSRRNPFWDSIFAVSNGYLGIRGSFDEKVTKADASKSQGMYINSAYCKELHAPQYIRYKGDNKYYHAMINLFDWLPVNVYLEEEQVSLMTGNISDYSRELDMKNGLVIMSYVWEGKSGKKVKFETKRIASMVRRHCAVATYAVTPLNFSEKIKFESKINHRVYNRQFGDRPVKLTATKNNNNNTFTFNYELEMTKIKVSSTIGHKLNGKIIEGYSINFSDEIFSFVKELEVHEGKTVILEKYGSFASSFDKGEDEIDFLTIDEVSKCIDIGYSTLEKEQAEYWSNFWSIADVKIEGNIADQQAMRFSLFHLQQGNPENDKMSISATGMTGNNYNGHVFWDTEMYMVPFFLHIKPEAAKNLLMYRYHILNKARERAKQMDGVGALYSWMSIDGEETNAFYECATAQYHINSDVAYAISKYFENTSDIDFLDNYGAEIVFETAKFLGKCGRYIPMRNNQFCINMVCGPDEYGCMVNNNAYTNAMVKYHFEFAVSIWEGMTKRCPEKLDELCQKIDLSEKDINHFRKAAENMFENYIEELGIHAQDDSYFYKDPVDMTKTPRNVDIRHNLHPLNAWKIQATKQADVVLMMLTLGNRYSKEVKKANYDFYEPKTVHSSSLSVGIHSIIANEIGNYSQAYDYFQQCLYLDLKDLRRNTAGGIHFACLGAGWMGIVNGFAGMREYKDELLFNPILPDAWKSYSFKINYKGRIIDILVQKDKTVYTLEAGEPIEFKSGNEVVLLFAQKPVATSKTSFVKVIL